MAKQELKRQIFEMSREIEFFTEKELEMQIGHGKTFWPSAILKELIDNALDACETSDISPQIEIKETEDSFSVQDNGPGLPAKIIKRSLNYLIRVSDKQFYVSPTRGQMGNALKTVWAAPFVATGLGRIVIESKGLQHTIKTSLDRITQKPQIDHGFEANPSVRNGTCVTVYWKNSSRKVEDEIPNSYKSTPPSTDELIRGYAIFNPHASFTFRFQHHSPTNLQWAKWRTDMPTSVHWYDSSRLRDLIAAYVSLERGKSKRKTVREFVLEFRGLSSTQKQKEITDGFSGVYLSDLVHDGDISIDTVQELLRRMKEGSRPVSPRLLGLIGEEHFKEWCENHYSTIPTSFKYKKISGVDGQELPFQIEIAFAVKKDTSAHRTIITGLNWTPTLGIPAKEINDAIGKCRVDYHDPVVLIIHLAKPRLEFVDRGKTRLAL